MGLKPSNAEDGLVRSAPTIFLNNAAIYSLHPYHHCKYSQIVTVTINARTRSVKDKTPQS